jgi:FKBP-type peptidyl-prolyl cis-trans isomerase SlyD
MQIGDRTVATFHYTLTDTSGKVLDSSVGGEPLTYLHGVGNIVPGLERELTGRSAGDKLEVTLQPEDGYGEPNPAMVQVVPRQAFQGVDDLEVGMQFQAQTPQGALPVVISKVEGDQVTVDANHPLAGQVLHFAVEVTDVRNASVEELMHGHVHGEGGHQH